MDLSKELLFTEEEFKYDLSLDDTSVKKTPTLLCNEDPRCDRNRRGAYARTL